MSCFIRTTVQRYSVKRGKAANPHIENLQPESGWHFCSKENGLKQYIYYQNSCFVRFCQTTNQLIVDLKQLVN